MKHIKVNTIIIIAVFLAAILLSSCSSTQKTETREVSGFNALSASAFGEYVIRQGEIESLTIQAPSDYLRYLETRVEDGTLHIDLRRGLIGGPVRRVTYTITVKELNGLHLSGAGSIKVLDGLQSDDLNVSLSGAGSIEIDDLQAKSLSVNFSSAGAIVIAGQVDSQSVNLSGLGSYETGDLECRTATVNLSGAGSATLWVTENLDVAVSGVGSVNYFGNPQISQNVSGLGSVHSKGAHK